MLLITGQTGLFLFISILLASATLWGFLKSQAHARKKLDMHILGFFLKPQSLNERPWLTSPEISKLLDTTYSLRYSYGELSPFLRDLERNGYLEKEELENGDPEDNEESEGSHGFTAYYYITSKGEEYLNQKNRS